MQGQHSRREFLGRAGGAAAGLALAGPGSALASGARRHVRLGRAATEMTFTTWQAPAEEKAYKQIIAAFQKANPGITVKLEAVPYSEINQNLDARLQAGKAPDMFRTTFNDIGFYGANGALVDLSKLLPAGFSKAYNPALWGAVLVNGKPYGVPQHTDVSALVYNKTLLKQAGITKFPKSLDQAWTWNEFLDVARTIKAKTKAYPFAMNWQLAGSYRWLNFVYQAGGTMLKGGKPNLESAAAHKALALFKTWKDEKLYPPSAGPKGPQYPDEIFPSGKVAMIFAGDFLLPSINDTVKKFQWGATYLPRDRKAATDLGGTAVAVTKDAKDPAAAAKFLAFLVNAKSEKLFCEQTGTLPSHLATAKSKLHYVVRPDLMPLYNQQASTLPADLVRAVTIPNFTAVNNAMTKELDAFLGGQSANTTLKNMDQAIAKVL